MAALILSGAYVNNEILRTNLESFLGIFGRNLSFTGRTDLWEQAIYKFRTHFLFGSGVNTYYVLATGAIQPHAHSSYLDMLSKYGAIVFICFCGIIISISIKMRKKERAISQKLIVIMVLCTLIHCITEDANQMLLFMIVMLCDSVKTIDTRTKPTNK